MIGHGRRRSMSDHDDHAFFVILSDDAGINQGVENE